MKVKDSDKCNIEEQEWRQLLAEVETEGQMPDGKTRDELQAIWGLGRSRTRERLKELLDKGRVVRGWKPQKDSGGRTIRIPAYKMKKGSITKAKRKKRK